MSKFQLVFFLAVLQGVAPLSRGQSVTGQISGSVVDRAGAHIAGASIRLSADLTGQSRVLTSDAEGNFLFTNLVPALYSVRIDHPGFKAWDEKSINVGAQEKVALHDIKLTVGDVSTTVEVLAEAARVDTDSADRSISINADQIANTPLNGRDYLGILRSLPGVQLAATNDRPGWGAPAPGVNGGQSGQFLVTLDGIASQDSGAPGTGGYLAPNVDAIGEVKVLVSNYSAEYGARAGGQMNVQIKSGTGRYHGTGYYFWRHEEFSANEWFNNRTGVTKPKYRYQNPGGTIGGPLFIPGTRFNRAHAKLFFFFSEDYLHTYVTGGVSSYNMPTALERSGDFSQTVTSTGVPIPVKAPLTGTVYPGNKIPTSQIHPIGFAIANLFPLPGTIDPTGRRAYNNQYQFSREQPREDRILRLDYSLGPKTTSYARLIQDFQGDRGVGSQLNGGGGWGQFASNYDIESAGVSFTVIRTFSVSVINETTVGINRAHQIVAASSPEAFKGVNDLSALKGPDGTAVTLPHFFNGNYLNILPNISFGTNGAQSVGQAVTAPPAFSYDSRFPFNGTDQLTNVTDNLTWVKGRHNLRFGTYFEHDSRNVSVYSTYNAAGSYWFGSDTSNPYDTGYAYSNLLAGSVQAYGEDNTKLANHARYNQFEWFVQDAWKVHRRVSLDLGLRFQVLQPTYSAGGTLGLFSGAAYDANKSGQLLFPALANGQKVAFNPTTGVVYPFARATSFDPASYPANGLPYSGLVQYKDSFFHTPPVQYGPRLGFAWDVFGAGKTAVRGGFGIFYGRAYGVDTIGATSSGTGPLAAPPAFRAPIYYNTSFSNLLATQGYYGAQNVNGGSPDYKNPTTYNWSFGIQQDLRKGMILDVAYVANVSHHGFGTANDANAVAPLTDWTPTGGLNKKFLDPTSANGGTGAFYATNLIRALTGYQGYGSISTYTSLGESSYNSLQVQLNRRFSRRFMFSTNYTFSKTIIFSHQQWIPDNLTKNVTNRPHAVNLIAGFDPPKGSRIWPNFLTRAALDGWHLNGVAAIFSGTPLTVACTVTNAPIGYWTGTPTGGIPLRCQMNGNLWLPAGTPHPANIEQRLWYPFNAASFSLPPADSLGFGNTQPTLTYGPGFYNIDLAANKSFKVREKTTLEVKAEAFNALNHFNPSNPNSTLTYNFSTGAQTNASFGAISGAQHNARRMSLSLKLRF